MIRADDTGSLFRELQSHAGTRKKIRVEIVGKTDEPTLNGFVISCSETLCLMHSFNDFEPDGYTIFWCEDARSIRCGEHERHWDRMLASEGLLGGLDIGIDIDLSSMRSALESIAERVNRLSIEYDSEDPEILNCVVGEITSISDDTVCFDHFDGLGIWTSEPTPIEIESINRVEFLTPYIEMFWKHTDRSE